jgi:hypothetical protein
MKKSILYKIQKAAGLLLLTSLLAGCEDFLSKEPDSTRASISSPKQVSQLLTTAYPNSGYVVMAESMSDNVVDKGIGVDDKTNRFSFLFEEVDATVGTSDAPDSYWAECYRAISVCNEALHIIDTSADPTQFNAQKGEALIARAYAHFMLVSFFSKFYNAETAAGDPGIPYVTEPENVVIKKYERRTVAYVYEMIEKDLLAGLPLINDGSYTVPKYHFNLAAANAFAARFYLFKKDYAKVLQYTNAAFPGTSIGDNLRPWNTTMESMSPDELQTIYSQATQRANLLLVETASLIGRHMPRYRFGLSFGKQREIFASDAVVGATANWSYPVYYQGDNNYFVPKWYEYFVRETVNAETGVPYVMLPLFTAEEVLFNRAEASVYQNQATTALADLNLFLSKRISGYNAAEHTLTAAKLKGYYGSNSLADNLLKAILDFKRVEFMQEGMRWFDLQRYAIPVTHTDNLGNVITSVSANDLRRVFQLPQSATLSGLELNAR